MDEAKHHLARPRHHSPGRCHGAQVAKGRVSNPMRSLVKRPFGFLVECQHIFCFVLLFYCFAVCFGWKQLKFYSFWCDHPDKGIALSSVDHKLFTVSAVLWSTCAPCFWLSGISHGVWLACVLSLCTSSLVLLCLCSEVSCSLHTSSLVLLCLCADVCCVHLRLCAAVCMCVLQG
jgi:hypothetical protein